MLLNNYFKKSTCLYCNIKYFTLALLIMISCALVSSGCAPQYTSSSVISPGDSSMQLLPDRSIGLLTDRLTITGDHKDVDPMAHLTVFNRTNHTMTIALNGTPGTYNLSLEPKRDHTWLINEGNYHVEINIPGFPPTAAEGLSLTNYRKYKWEIFKTKPLAN